MEQTDRRQPLLDGYTYVRWLGGGGFADVYLYAEHLPSREVAVKVLKESVDDDEMRRQFTGEANLMASVSGHPNIVTVYGAGVSVDGRPYLVMEYCPFPNFAERMRSGQLAVDEVLRVGIKVASAIETAHRSGIIHRDIKPANILETAFGEPGLTDFGISAARTSGSFEESAGFSPFYAPPEVLAKEQAGDVRSDVYSLAATLWALLAGHAPFEVPGGSNRRSDITSRTLNEAVPAIPRRDVAGSLERALRHALAKDPKARPSSARELALALQAIEAELRYQQTAFNLQQAAPLRPSVDLSVPLPGKETFIGGGMVVNPDVPAPPQAQPGLIGHVPPGGRTTPVEHRIEPLPVPFAPEEPGTIRRDEEPKAAPVAPKPEARRLPVWALPVAAAATALIGGVVLFAAFKGGGSESAVTTVAAEIGTPDDALVATAAVDAITEPSFRSDAEGVVMTWVHPDGEGVQFEVVRTDAAALAEVTIVDTTEFVVGIVPDGTIPCVEVRAFIPGTAESEPVGWCAS